MTIQNILETSDFEKEMYSNVEQVLIQATNEMEIEEEVLIGVSIASFDSSFEESPYFQVNFKQNISGTEIFYQ